MIEKVVKLGIEFDPSCFYDLTDEGIQRVPGSVNADGERERLEGAASELIAPKTWEWEDGYSYRLDDEGDLVRYRLVPEQRWAVERRLPAMTGDTCALPVSAAPQRYWVIVGSDEDPDWYLKPKGEDVWSFNGELPQLAAGDGVFVWVDKPHYSIVALAEASSAARENDDGGFDVPVRFLTNTMERPMYRNDLLYDKVLEKAAFLEPKADALSALEEVQAQRLLRWAQHRNPATAPICGVWSEDLNRRLGTGDSFVPADDYERDPVRRPPASIETTHLDSGQDYRVLSVHPPWAWAIIHAGKDVENRSWTTPYRGSILIHASSKKYVGKALEEARAAIAKNSGLELSQIPKEFPRSQMVGMVDVKDCIPNSRSLWAFKGEEHWLLENPKRLDPPLDGIDGKLNLWTWKAP